ncbi:MAG: phosphatidylserine decarboxylase family protein [bacterium]|nr:phosphatidylserine decarboxylase family protein [bacterium]
MPVTKDGLPVLIPVLVVTALSLWLAFCKCGGWWYFAVPMVLFTLFSLWFFRDPERKIPVGEDTIVSPGDGKVLELVPVEHDEFIGGPAQRLSIFLSVFNVHVNRNCISGVVRDVKRFPGKFRVAYDHRATEENNRLRVDLESPKGKLRCVQVTGAIARRIVCHLSVGDSVTKGERYGMIRFGSRMDIILPATAKVVVKKDDSVHGGSTVIAHW